MRWCRAAAALLALLLLGSVPGLAQTPVTVIGPVTVGNCVQFFSPVQVKDAGTVCGGAAGSVSSVTNSDSTLTFAPTTGNVIGSLNLAHSNTWTVAQTFAGLTASSITDTGITGSTQCVQASTAGLLSGTGTPCGAGGGGVTSVSDSGAGTLTISPTTGAVLAAINLAHANTWSGAQSFGAVTVTTSFTATGLVTLADHATQAANTVLGNGTSLTASPTALAVPSCSTAGSALSWTSGTGFGCNSSITAASVPASGLTGTTLASNVVTSSLTTVGTLTGGATGAGFTINFGASTESGILGLANGGTNAALTASNGGVVYSTGSALAILAGTVTANQCLLSGSSAAPSWGTCPGAVSSVSNSDSTLTISPTTGAVVASLNLGHSNTWTVAQTFNAGATVSTLTDSALVSAGTQCVQASTAGVLSGTGAACGSGSGAVNSVSNADGTLTISPTTGAVVASLALGHANTWSAAQTFPSSDIIMGGSSTGVTTFASANAGASNFTITFPAATGTVALAANANVASVSNADGTLTISPTTGAVVASIALGHANTWTAAQTFSASGIKLLGSSTGATTFTSANAGVSNFTLTLPAVTDTVAVLGTSQTHSATQTFSGTLNVSGTFQIGGTTVTLPISLANGGTNNALTASAGGIVWSDASKLNILAGTSTAGQCLLSGNLVTPSWGACPSAVSSVSNADGTLTISPTTGAVVASLALGHANTWTAAQTFTNSDILLLGSSTGATTFASANAGASNFTITFPAATGTVALTSGVATSVSNADGTLTISPTTGAVVASIALGHANSWTAAQTFPASGIKLLGSSTGVTTFTSANAGASNFTLTFPAVTDTLAVLGTAQTWTAAQTFSNGITVSSSFTATGLVTLADMAVQAANTVLGNATAGSASPTALAMTSCSTAASAVIWTTSTGFGCNTSITAAAVPASGLTGTTLASNVVTSSLTSVGTLTGGATGAGFTIALGTSTITGILGLANGGTAAALTASNGGIVYSTASALAILAGTVTSGQCLLSGSSAAPTWGSCSGGAAVSSVTNVDGTLTISPTTGAVVASIALAHANLWTALPTVNIAGIAATSTDGLVIENTTAAAVGAQQWSPRLHFIGQGWKTTATAASQTVDWIEELQPVQGAANPSANLVTSFQINGGGYTTLLSMNSGTSAVAAPSLNVVSASLVLSGNISAPAWTTSGIQYVDVASTVTDTSSSGTVATAYTGKHGGNTIAASSATTFTNYYGSYFLNEIAGTNVTLTNKWALGADSAQINGTLNITGGGLQFGGNAAVPQPQGRLTLLTGTPVMITNQTAKSQVFYDCYKGGKLVPVYNGTYDVVLPIASCEISMTMPTSGTGVTNTAGVFDVWGVAVAGALAICVATNGSGGGWASDTAGTNTARGTGYSQIDTTTRPYITNKNAITNCYTGSTQRGSISANQATYLGTLYTTAAGQTGMNFAPAGAVGGNNSVLGLFNAYNREPAAVMSRDTTANWTNTSNTWRAADGNANNSVNYVDGLGIVTAFATYTCAVQASTAASTTGVIGINRNSTSATPAIQAMFNASVTSTGSSPTATGIFVPSLGLNTLTAMEAASTAGASFLPSWNAFATQTQGLQAMVNM